METITDKEEIEGLFKGFDYSKVSLVNIGTKIYKEECVLSYHSTKSKKGLFVCLKTFLAFSSVYLNDYHEKTGNNIFLNIKKVVKPKMKKTKTVVQVEGGDSLEIDTGEFEDDYETLISLVFYKPLNKVIPLPCPHLPIRVQQTIGGVMNSQSESKKQEMIRLGEDLIFSKYTKDLVQTKPEGFKPYPVNGPWKCAECDLTTNLWLNLGDGYIGCGRSGFGGIGGKNHGIAHFKETGNPLVVKLGTITADKADVFSYAEKAMVYDEFLDKHLRFYGLDRKKMKKTDLSMAEINLDLNLKSEYASIMGTGKKKKFVFGPGMTGMANLGNSCYMNSALQVLFSVDEFRKRYYDLMFLSYFRDERISDPTTDLECMMVKVANGLLSGIYSVPSEVQQRIAKYRKEQLKEKKTEEVEGEKMVDEGVEEEEDGEGVIGQDGIRPTFAKLILGKDHPYFSKGGQEDPDEYLMHVFQKIERYDMLNPKNRENPIHPFKYVVEQRIECSETKQVRYRETEENKMMLPIDTQFAENRSDFNTYKIEREKELKEQEIQKQARMLENAKKKKLAEEARNEELKAFELELEQERALRLQTKKEPVPPVRPVLDLRACIERQSSPHAIQQFYSPGAGKNVVAFSTYRFKTFPKYLMVKLNKYYTNELYQARKIDTCMKGVEKLDLGSLRARGLQEGEVEMSGKDKPQKKAKTLQYSEDLLTQLTSMGFPENRSKRACIGVNNTNVDAAINWMFQHENDADIDAPLPSTDETEDEDEEEEDSGAPAVSEELIGQITAMGIPREAGIFSLQKTDNNVMRAVDYYFNHMGEIPGLMSKEKEEKEEKKKLKKLKKEARKENALTDGEGEYELFAFISHLGNNVQSGHYVCHIKKGKQWVFFNDSEVLECEEVPFDRGYIYFYKRVEK